MKIIFLTFGLFLVVQSLFSQKIIENPRNAFSTVPELKITKIELNDTSTVCHFEYSNFPNVSFSVPKRTYILPEGSDEKLFVTYAENLTLNQQVVIPASGVVNYTLFFPKINPLTPSLEFGEANKGGNWFIYEIELIKQPYKGLIAEELIGYWYASDGSKELIVALFDTMAVYNSQAWSYKSVKHENNQLKFVLANNTGKLNINATIVDEKTILLGTTATNQVKLNNYPIEVANYSNPNNKPFAEPILSKNGQATYKGFIRNYNTKYIEQKTGQLHVNNVLTGNQTSHVVKIENDGTFSISFPVAYPVQIYSKMPMSNEPIFVEPGKETFHIIDPVNTQSNYFMGEMALVNTNLMDLKKIRHFDYSIMGDTILQLTPEQFRAYCFQTMERELADLKSMESKQYISPKAIQIMKMNISYGALSKAMEYKWIYESAYRTKNKIPREQRDFKIDIPVMDSAYFKPLITNELLNNPLAPASNSYDSYINRVKYNEHFRTTEKFKPLKIVNELAKKGIIQLSNEEQVVIDKEDELNESTSERMMDNQEQHKAHQEATMAIFNKYKTDISEYINSERDNIRIEKLKQLFGVEKGLATDIMTSQDLCRKIVEEASPMEDDALKLATNNFSTPFFADYIAAQNELTKERIKANKLKTGYSVNLTPNVDADRLFEAMMEKYKGKVVFIDFWATWCGPCRSANERIKPLKEELEGKDIVFVYITGPSSPEGTWNNMIPDINGEHYRVNEDEWSNLSNKFNVRGIPHYVLVDKMGAVAKNNGMPTHNLAALKSMFEEFLAK